MTPPLRAATYETLIGLMAVTGLRVGEALGLDRADVDLDDGALHVRAAKQNKQREVPLHDTTTEALREYAHRRDRHCRAGNAGVLRLAAGPRLTAERPTQMFRS